VISTGIEHTSRALHHVLPRFSLISIVRGMASQSFSVSGNTNPAVHRHHDCGALRRPVEESVERFAMSYVYCNCLLDLCLQFVIGHLSFCHVRHFLADRMATVEVEM